MHNTARSVAVEASSRQVILDDNNSIHLFLKRINIGELNDRYSHATGIHSLHGFIIDRHKDILRPYEARASLPLTSAEILVGATNPMAADLRSG
jgi:hypothetical protein